MTNEELQAIRNRADKAMEGNPLKDYDILRNMVGLSLDDIPKLLAEVERLEDQADEDRCIARTNFRIADELDANLYDIYNHLRRGDVKLALSKIRKVGEGRYNDED